MLKYQRHIPKRASQCKECGTQFKSSQEIVSSLQESDEEFLRGDYCPKCFKPDGAKAVWKVIFQSNQPIKDPLEKSYALLMELHTSEVLEEQQEAFLLAEYLVRRKILANRVKAGVYEHLETGEMLQIKTFDLLKIPASEIQQRLKVKTDAIAH